MANLEMQDEELIRTFALPNAASGSVTCDAIQIKGGKDPQGGFYSEVELKINVPELSATILPANAKLTVTVQESDTDDDTGWNAAGTIFTYDIDGSSSGAVASEKRYRLPIQTKKFVRVKATLNASATDASAVSMTAGFVF